MADSLLVIEPDASLRDAIYLHATLDGYSCDTATDARAAIERAAAGRFDAVVMDMAVTPDGLRFCHALRAHESLRRAPILLLSRASRAAEALAALEICADDFLTVPFGMRELLARVRALVRRTRLYESRGRHVKTIVRHGLVIDPARRRVHVDGCQLTLTEQEFQLLFVLAAKPETVFSRDSLLARIWGDQTFVTMRSVDALVKRVRRKLRSTSAPADRIVTVRGIGYTFEDATPPYPDTFLSRGRHISAAGLPSNRA